MKMNPKAVKLLVLIWVFGLLHSAPVRAQVSGATLSGTITDAQGGAVAGAKVSVKNLGTGIVSEATTNDSGAYSVPNLTPADYEVSVTAAGFSTTTAKVTLTVGAKQEMNIKLTVGQVSQTVEVTGAALQVDMASFNDFGQRRGQRGSRAAFERPRLGVPGHSATRRHLGPNSAPRQRQGRPQDRAGWECN